MRSRGIHRRSLAVGALFVALSTAASALVAPPVSAVPARSKTPLATATGLDRPGRKEIAMKLVSSAENSTLAWRKQHRYIEDIHDGRGYTGGIIGFCSGTGDMLVVVRRYTRARPHRNFDLAPPLTWHVYGDRYRNPAG